MTSTRSRLAAAIAISSLMVSGCSLRRVDSYLARGADLASYRTFAWGSAGQGATGDVRLDNNQMFQERVQAAVENQLASRGFEKTEGEAQLLVHYHAGVEQRIDLTATEPWKSSPECRPFIYDAGTLVIDLVDRRTNELLWRGWSNANIDHIVDNQQWLEKHIDDTVAKIFERLPGQLVVAAASR